MNVSVSVCGSFGVCPYVGVNSRTWTFVCPGPGRKRPPREEFVREKSYNEKEER